VIEVRIDDLASGAAAAILRPIAADGTAATVAARRLEVVAGPTPFERLRHLGELPVGSATITAAGSLAAEYLVHVVVRSYDQPVTSDIVRRALINGFRRLDEWAVDSVVLPLLGTGAGNLEPETAVTVVVPFLIESARAHARRITLVVEGEYELDLVERELRRSTESLPGG
jgi:O-acetyl-ADP-ribose deacetylase (regulator of RNase III)